MKKHKQILMLISIDNHSPTDEDSENDHVLDALVQHSASDSIVEAGEQ
jgi:hypothetical protein